MLRFAWWSMRGRWERVVTLCLGLICISICTTLLAGIVQLSTLTANQQISRAWHAPYDLLVRSPADLSPVERQLQIVDPSSLEQTYGGISLEQASIIARIPHVAVAAPEVVVGWVLLRPYVEITFSKSGLYRVTTELVEPGTGSTRKGIPTVTRIQNLFEVQPLAAYKDNVQTTTKVTYVPLNAASRATVLAFWPLPTMLVGIDPGAEARLVGLHWQPAAVKPANAGGLPLLMDTHPWEPLTATLTAERASLASPVTVDANSEKGSLSATYWIVTTRQQFDNRGLLALLARELGGQEPQSSAVPLQGGGVTRYARVGYALTQAGSMNSVQPVINVFSTGADTGGFLTRLPLLPQATSPWVTFGNGGTFTTFDAARLSVLSNGSSLSAPLGLYRPEPTQAPLGLFPQRSIASWPPMLFTTASAACALIGAQCISAIRVRVAGLGSFGQRSEALLQQVAADIEERTGLHVDVLTGASGRQINVQLMGDAGSSPSFSEIWVQPHAAITIANGVNGTNVLLLLAEVSIAALALIAAALLSTNSRRDDIEILWRMGWSNGRVLIESIVEAGVTTLLAALPALALPLLLGRLGAPAIQPAAALCSLGSAALFYITIVALATRAILAGCERPVARRGWNGRSCNTVQRGRRGGRMEPDGRPQGPTQPICPPLTPTIRRSSAPNPSIVGAGEDVDVGIGPLWPPVRAHDHPDSPYLKGIDPDGRQFERHHDHSPWWWAMLLRQLSRHRGSSALVTVSIAGACALVSLMLLAYWELDGLLYSTLLGQRVQVSLSSIHIITASLTCASAGLTAGLTLLLVVRERRREFGVLLAIGWTGRTLAGEIVRESMALGLLGGLCGGMAAVVLFLGSYRLWSPLLFAGCILGAALLGAALCALAALYPAFLVARFSPKQVLAKH